MSGRVWRTAAAVDRRPFSSGVKGWSLKMGTILVVEDEPALRATIAYQFRREGHEVVVATDGEQALAAARQARPDVVVLDLMLPKIDGLEVCRQLRHESTVPILILTARTDEVDKIVGLEVGADDYMTKPFSMRELVARVKAMLRRAAMLRQPLEAEADAIIVCGDLEIDVARRRVRRGGQEIHLKPKEFELLAFLARHPGRVFTRSHLLERVWGYDYVGDPRTVDVHVRWLRQKLEDDPAQARLLQTVRGVGYRLGSTQD